ncbi:hypothetical protein MNBD_GAMMA21-1649 [hydrothermal vent metagenome]|uniref:Uncharacterized protein n=1 Tax=hydrothermal vent metagenome TaxID=652676 RepID=A0A3B1B3D8_9ZZZZ
MYRGLSSTAIMVYSLKISKLQHGITIVLLILGVSASISTASEEPAKAVMPGYQTSQIIIGSSAQVLLKQNTSITLLNYCALKFKHLAKSAHSAAQNWQLEHAEIINKANAINRYVASTIEIRDSSFAAEKFQLKIDAQVYDGAQKFKSELTSKNRKQQHYLCNRLILSTALGEWDLIKVIPQHVQRVLQFKLKE